MSNNGFLTFPQYANRSACRNSNDLYQNSALKVEVCQRSGQYNYSWTHRQTDRQPNGETNRQGKEQWTDEGNDELTDGQTNGLQGTQLKG